VSAFPMMMQANAGGQVAQIAEKFGVDWPHLTAQVISFSIVCAVLYRLAYKPVLRMLDARRQQIAEGLASTEKINAALAAIDTERKDILADAHAGATRLIEEARGVALRVKDRETQRAMATAEQIVLKAHEAGAREQARMMRELRREVGQLVVKTTAAVTGKILTADDQRRLAEQTATALTAS
jgi:F-type H+-transporting ATPase subunit b